MKKTTKRILAACMVSLGVMLLAGGCIKTPETPETEAPVTEKVTEAPTEKITETEIQTETEKQTELEENVIYTSQDKSIRIVLPDSTWKVTQDVDEMRVFSSGAAMINIVHAARESELKKISVAESEEELEITLTRQYPDANAFVIQSFEHLTLEDIDTYEYVVNYNSKSMWAYAVTYCIRVSDEAYVITGTVTDDNKTLLDAVIKSVESFAVLQNEKFKIFSGETETETETETEIQTESETSATKDPDAEKELGKLINYGTTATLYASDNVNVRFEPSTNSDIIGSVNEKDAVTVIGETPYWFKVNINGMIGYISKQFLINKPENKETEQSETTVPEETNPTDDPSDSDEVKAELNGKVDYDSAFNLYATTDVNVRVSPGTDAGVVDSLTPGSSVRVVGETDNWYIVEINGTIAYVSKSYLTSTQPEVQTEAPSTEAPQENPQTETPSTEAPSTEAPQEEPQTDAPSETENVKTETEDQGTQDEQLDDPVVIP